MVNLIHVVLFVSEIIHTRPSGVQKTNEPFQKLESVEYEWHLQHECTISSEKVVMV